MSEANILRKILKSSVLRLCTSKQIINLLAQNQEKIMYLISSILKALQNKL